MPDTDTTYTAFTELRQALLKVKGERTERQLAEWLGIPWSSWISAMNQKRPIGRFIIKTLLNKCPELTPLIIAYQRDGHVNNES